MPTIESERLLALEQYEILDTPPEAVFDDLVRAAARALDTPVALISLMDSDRQWFKARVGLNVRETSRELAFCDHAVREKAVFLVSDATSDDRFADNPLVTGPPGIRFYAGAPLITNAGHAIGALCVIDFDPRDDFGETKLKILQELADVVMSALTMRSELLRRREAEFRLIAQEEAARSHSDELRQMIDTVVDGVIIIDEQGAIQTVNPACVNMFGYSVAAMTGQNVRMLMPEGYAREHDQYLKNYHDTGEAKIIGIGREVTGRRSDGSEFPMELSVGEMRSGEVRRYVGIIRDITERKEVERMKNEFISTVSHELRTPLTSIKGALGLIRSGATGELPAASVKMFDIAYNNADRLVRLINDILDMEKISAGKMDFDFRPVELGALVEQAVEANKAYAAQYGVTFKLVDNAPGAVVDGDADRLMQVLANLLSNAAKFSPAGGRVDVGLHHCERGFRVSVADQGQGVPAAFKDRIFGRFAQADSSDTRQKGGTGLGLHIAEAIVAEHDGVIGFESEEGRGATFYFDLPAREGAAAAGAAAGETPIRRVLICNPQREVATLLGEMCLAAGLVADIAETAAGAETMLQSGAYAALMLDIGLPGQDGADLILKLRAAPATRELPIIVVSALASEAGTQLIGGAMGVVDWIQKPIKVEQLSERLRQAIDASAERRLQILHVEDDPDIIQVVRSLTSDLADTTAAPTLAAAKRLARQHKYDLVLLDLILPDGDGAELSPMLKSRDGVPTPVIIFSSQECDAKAAANVRLALLKSRTTNEQLQAAIHEALKA